MYKRSSGSLAIGVASLVAMLLQAAPAAAAGAAPSFGCRGSVAAVRLTLLPTVEPFVANRGGTPCATQSAGVSSATLLGSAATGSVALAGPAGAFTYSSKSADTTLGPVAPAASTTVSVDGATIAVPGGSLVAVGPVEAHAAYECVNGSVVASSGSTLDVVKVNGSAIALPAAGAPLHLPIGPGSSLDVNQRTQTALGLTERVLDLHLAGLGDVVVGEAQVTRPAGDPCAGSSGGGTGGGGTGGGGTGGGGTGGGGTGGGGTGGGGTGGGGSRGAGIVNACPQGSTLIASTRLCEITVAGGGLIVVSEPYKGPTGGTVTSLPEARKRYHSACLYGAGPAFAIVGTNHADRINGTRQADRILGLGGNDRLAGQGANDCIDGGSGKDSIYGGSGNVRIYGGPGNDRISAQSGNAYVDGGSGNDRNYLGNGNDRALGGSGNDRIGVGRGNDRVWGGSGNDHLSLGNGNDWIWGGSGNDLIYAGNGVDHLFGESGNDRLYGPGLSIYANCGSGRNLAYVNATGMHYARVHGCQRVRQIREHRL